jgi:ABC-2 type transport system permease protein
VKRELRAEWTKLRTVAGTNWLMLGIIALTVALTAAVCATTSCDPSMGCHQDTIKLSLSGVQLGQAVVAVLAVLAIGGEYGTGMIRVTFAAMPRRATVLAAKAVLVTGLTLVAGTIAVLASLLVGRSMLPGNGFTPAHGFPVVALTDGPTVRAALGSVLYLGLIALLSLGVAAAVRDSAAAIGVVLGLLYVLPVVVLTVSEPDWQLLLWRVSPMDAGLAIQSTTHLANLPLPPWAGLGVLAAWAVMALVGGGLLLRLRDA